jgi:mannose-1-phosphate guanylyltransferase/phosphomannomutase
MSKAVIMAGGFGTRLRPLTMKIPKPMVPIMNEPMMGHIIRQIEEVGIKDIVSVLYFLPDTISDYFGDGSDYNVNMEYVMAQADFGTAGAVKNAEATLDQRVIIISGDVLTDIDLKSAIAFHEERDADATILLTRVETPLEYGIVMTEEDGKINRFLEKPSWGQVFSDTINTGIYILEPHVLDMIPKKTEYDFSKDLFPDMLEKGMGLYGYIAEGYWRDVGNLNEYHKGQLDSLHGLVKLPFFRDIEDDSYIGEGSDISAEATLTGKNVIGENCIISPDVRISNCVIGNNCYIGKGAVLQGTTLWDNVKIGAYSSLNEDVVCSETEIGDKVTVGEHVFISNNCEIGDGAHLFGNIKLWPEKRVEEDAVLTTSLVRESKWNSKLFTDARISGISNIEMNPEFGAKLGASYGNTIGAGSRILASRDPDTVSRLMKRSIAAGLLSVGIEVNDLREMSIPQTRQEIATGKYEGGFHVRRSPRNPDNIDVIIFSKDGRDIPISTTKKIERFFYGEDIKRVHYTKVGKIAYPERTNEIYVSRFLESIDISSVEVKDFRLLMDYSFGLASGIFPFILGQMKVKSLSLHDYIDGSRFHPDPSDRRKEDGEDETPNIMRSLNYNLGFRIEPGAEKITFIDEKGNWYDQNRMLTIVTKLFFEAEKCKGRTKTGKCRIAVSILGSSTIDHLAKEYGAEVVRIKNNHSAMMEATRDSDIKFVGGVYGGFIFSDFLKASDGMFTIAKLLEMSADTGLNLSELDLQVPKRTQLLKSIVCDWKSKGTVMRMAMDYSKDHKRELIEGVKIFIGDEDESWVLLLPSKEEPEFNIYAESTSEGKTNSIIAKYSELVKDWANRN